MSDIEQELTSLDEEIVSIRGRARACVEQLCAMPDADAQFLFAERLRGLGSVIVPNLYELILGNPSASSAQKYLAAWLAALVGDRGPAGEHLCREVTSGSSYALPAANALSHLGLTQGREPVTAALKDIDPHHVTDVFEWAMALHGLGGKLPHEVRLDLRTRSSHWAARAVLDAFPEEIQQL